MSETSIPRTVDWVGGLDGIVRLIDQTELPVELVYRDCTNVEEIWEAIHSLRVRGAPAIGVAAAMGVLLGLRTYAASAKLLGAKLRSAAARLRSSRPTAVNLFWALERMERCFERTTAESLATEEI